MPGTTRFLSRFVESEGNNYELLYRFKQSSASSNPAFSVPILRYFNPVGSHGSGLIGEAPNGIPNNLMPYVSQVAKDKLEKLRVLGNDYPTVDGTGARDYIHVVDLAEDHVAALENLTEGVHVNNMGAGKGTSVLELVKAFEEVNDIEVPYEKLAQDIYKTLHSAEEINTIKFSIILG